MWITRSISRLRSQWWSKQSIPFIWFRLFAWIVHSFIRFIPYRSFSHSFHSICLFGICVAILPLLCNSNTEKKSGRNTDRICTWISSFPLKYCLPIFLRKQMSMLLRTQINEAYFYWNNAYANVTRQPPCKMVSLDFSLASAIYSNVRKLNNLIDLISIELQSNERRGEHLKESLTLKQKRSRYFQIELNHFCCNAA